jgi:hypothetical protein
MFEILYKASVGVGMALEHAFTDFFLAGGWTFFLLFGGLAAVIWRPMMAWVEGDE